jgi:proteasome lid subunit RPN8/RPN11
VKKRLDWLSNGENAKFFDISDFTLNKQVSSSAIWLTLTYNVERCSRFDAIENIGKEWNAFISALRQKYGKISVLRTWECSEKGYPHIHAILLFQNAEFSVFPHFSEKEGQLTFRIKEKDEIASLWHSHADVQAVSSTKKLFNYMKKYQTKTLLASDSPKGTRTMSLLWLFRKRGFSVSGDFRTRISDLIRNLHNSKTEIHQARLDGSLEECPIWEFVGVFTGQELGIHHGLWASRLNPAQIGLVLERESVSCGARGFGDWN